MPFLYAVAATWRHYPGRGVRHYRGYRLRAGCTRGSDLACFRRPRRPPASAMGLAHFYSRRCPVYELWLSILLLTAIPEEFAFRGVLLGSAARRWGAWRASLITSALSGLWHIAPTLHTMSGNHLFRGTAASAGGQVLLVLASIAVTRRPEAEAQLRVRAEVADASECGCRSRVASSVAMSSSDQPVTRLPSYEPFPPVWRMHCQCLFRPGRPGEIAACACRFWWRFGKRGRWYAISKRRAYRTLAPDLRKMLRCFEATGAWPAS